jgi:oxygen-independent coproporphyrinogen-3 oxidase
MEKYHEALSREIECFFSSQRSKKPIETIYFGGGTPSTYPVPLLLDMSGKLKRSIPYANPIEISLEVNPGTISPDKIDCWEQIGVNRVSVGVQSLNEQVLKDFNRHHTKQDVVNAVAQLSERFDVVSIDLIVGLPGVTQEQWKNNLRAIVGWPITHISMYFLTVHENTPLYFGVKTKKIELPCDEQTIDLYYWSIDFLAEHGFFQYEISSFARAGKECKHNKAYWQRKPYKGFGLGACSFDGQARLQNEKNLMSYMEGIMHDKDVTIWAEQVPLESVRIEVIMLGLRQTKGIAYSVLAEGLDDTQCQVLQNAITLLQCNSLIVRDGDTIRLTPKALVLEHEVIAALSV